MCRNCAIEVAPGDDEGWAVRFHDKTLAAFPGEACAVTFARSLADRMAAEGRRPRIRVRFGPTASGTAL